MRDLILKYVTMPMAIKVFKDDKKYFSSSKVNVLYYDLIDSILEELENDFKQLKADMYSKYHLDVKHLEKANDVVKYSVNKKVIEFTPNELRNKTKALMKEYLSTVEIKSREHIWKN